MTSLYYKGRGRLGLALGLAALLGAIPACGRSRAARPNVLLIVVSGLRADHVSAYGYRRPTTPAIDALAATGTLYENTIS
ncbi:MAG TPA: sulfatase-like hydrolase/transferase, partial [Candidatus Polarisedimenticolia bacterium]|nr:sulfatase-like hydrolase/transferase [Candidatus Polarisedimenticolia bacterium]